jgi:hypothetical protein
VRESGKARRKRSGGAVEKVAAALYGRSCGIDKGGRSSRESVEEVTAGRCETERKREIGGKRDLESGSGSNGGLVRLQEVEDDGEWRKLASGMEDGGRRREWRMELEAAARMEGGRKSLQRRREWRRRDW